MNQRKEYKSINKNNFRFLKEAKNLLYIANKNAVPYHITNAETIAVNDSLLKRIQNLFQKKFSEFETDVSLLAGLTFSGPSMLVNLKSGAKVYESIAISFSESELGTEAVSWPLLIVLKQSKKDLFTKVQNFIQRTLKCILRPIQLTEPQMLWIMGISISESLKRNLNCGMSLTCQLPIQTSAEIDIFFGEEVLSAMWESFHDSASNVIHFKELEVFFAQMASHTTNVYGIDVSQFRINCFLLKGIRLQFREQIKAEKPEVIYLLLSYLISDCITAD